MDAHPPGASLRCRPYAGEHDLQRMQQLLMEGRATTDDWRYPHVGDLMWDFFMAACHLNPSEHIRLWEDGDRLAGYAILGEDPAFQCQVLPQYAGSGIEADALAWADARLAELRSRDPVRWGGPLVSGARQDDARRIAFLEQRGFRYHGRFAEVNLLRSLEAPIAEAVVPPGCLVRAVEGVHEVSPRAAAQREVWQPWTVGDVSDDDYAALMRLPGYRRDLDLVAVTPDGVMAAYANGWLDPVNRVGDFGPVGALPAYRRQGLTRAVLLEGLRRMRAAGMDRACISTGVSNTPALQLYRSIGFADVNRHLDYVR